MQACLYLLQPFQIGTFIVKRIEQIKTVNVLIYIHRKGIPMKNIYTLPQNRCFILVPNNIFPAYIKQAFINFNSLQILKSSIR